EPPSVELAAPTPVVPSPVTGPPQVLQDASAAALGSPSLAEVRALLAGGPAQEALSQARAALAVQSDEENFWPALEGDALRALGRFDEATLSYERAAALAEPSERMQLG